ILPAWGILGDVLPFFARKPHHWYKGTVWALVIVTVLSAMVYGHHMFMTGMSPLLGEGYMLFTLLISAPSMVVVLNWVLTLWRGSVRWDNPMLFALATVFVLGVGGLSGQLLAGYAGQQRRLFDPFQYTFIQGLRGLNRWTSFFAFALFAGQFIFVWNFFKTLFGKTAPVTENPWGVTTLEWTATTSPPPFHNFEHIPEVVRGPHEFANPEVLRLTGRDFIGQAEQLPGFAGPELAAAKG